MIHNLLLLIQTSDSGGSVFAMPIMFVLIIGVFYFLILRPQQKRQKDRAKMLEAMKKGDKVVTSSGIYGTIEGMEDKTVLVKISDTTKVKMDKSAISAILGIIQDEKSSI